MSSSRLFLSGLRSRRARLRFTGRDQNELKWSCRSIDIQQTANSVLTDYLRRRHPDPGLCLRRRYSPRLPRRSRRRALGHLEHRHRGGDQRDRPRPDHRWRRGPPCAPAVRPAACGRTAAKCARGQPGSPGPGLDSGNWAGRWRQRGVPLVGGGCARPRGLLGTCISPIDKMLSMPQRGRR